MSELPPSAVAIIAKAWRDYKVVESPFLMKLLGQGWLKKRTVCSAKNWEAWLTPHPEKIVWWLTRLAEAFAARYARANAESLGKPVNLAAKAQKFRDEISEPIYLMSLAWADWQLVMRELLGSDKKLQEVNTMWSRGCFDTEIMSAREESKPEFQASVS